MFYNHCFHTTLRMMFSLVFFLFQEDKRIIKMLWFFFWDTQNYLRNFNKGTFFQLQRHKGDREDKTSFSSPVTEIDLWEENQEQSVPGGLGYLGIKLHKLPVKKSLKPLFIERSHKRRRKKQILLQGSSLGNKIKQGTKPVVLNLKCKKDGQKHIVIFVLTQYLMWH